MLVNLNEVLVSAREGGHAVGAFNIYSLETAQAVCDAAREQDSPVIFAFGEKYIDTANIGVIAAIVRNLAAESRQPMVLHLDHCKSEKVIYQAVRAGFSSVMFDGSGLDYAENLSRTLQVVEFAHAVGVSVEAELGAVPFDGDGEVPDECLTRPEEARDFVAGTGVDALAVAIGTAHGEYRGRPRLRHDRLAEIAGLVDVPLVMHGGSGVPDEDMLRSIELGIAKINVNTQISKVAVKRLQQLCAQEKPGHLAGLMKEAQTVMTAEVADFMRLFANGRN